MGGFGEDGSDATKPFAYLNYILFDDNLEMVDAGWERVPEDVGFDTGEESLENMHRKVQFDEPIAVSEAGYIYIWVSNESENTKVWFDDLKITHSQTLVTQATDYAVWGDVLREQKTDESIYRYAYQGQFAEKDEETGWNHFELREYDAVIGRWTSTDPYRQYYSPYVGIGNNPINGVDPNGGVWVPDENGNLVAEEGDDVFSLMGYFGGISFEEASEMFYNLQNWNGGTMASGISDVAGHILRPTNELTRMMISGSVIAGSYAGTLSAYQPDLFDRWSASDSWMGSMSYSFADDFYVAGHFFTPWIETMHLNGESVQGRDKVNAFAGATSSLVPYGRLVKPLNAAKLAQLLRERLSRGLIHR